jgi:hypothetical protein
MNYLFIYVIGQIFMYRSFLLISEAAPVCFAVKNSLVHFEFQALFSMSLVSS